MADNKRRSHDRVELERFLIDVAVALAAGVLIFTALGVDVDKDGGRDWDYFQADLMSARASILDNGQLPFWMLYRSGGHDAFADPQSAWLSPFGLLVLLCDFPIGARLYLAFCGSFGVLGMMRLCRHLGFSRPAGLLTSIIVFLSLPCALYAAGGIPTFTVGLAVLPWLILLVDSRSDRAAMLAGALLAMGLYCGDANHFVFHSLFVLVLAVLLAALGRHWRPIRSVLVTGVSAAVIAAPKAIPMLLFMLAYPRLVPEPAESGNMLAHLQLTYHAFLDGDAPFLEVPQGEFVCLLSTGKLVSVNSLTDEERGQVLDGSQRDWVNFGSYVGWTVIRLAAVGLAVCLWLVARRFCGSKSRHHENKRGSVRQPFNDLLPYQDQAWVLIASLILSGVVFYWLSFGVNITPSGWRLLKRLPVFSSIHDSTRLMMYLLIPIAVLAAVGMESVTAFVQKKLSKIAAVLFACAIVSLVMFDLHSAARTVYAIAFCETQVPLVLESTGFAQHTWVWSREMGVSTRYGPPVTPFVRAGKGAVNGYGALSLKSQAIPVSSNSYQGEVFFFEDGAGSIKDEKFTSREITFVYAAPESATVIINQNWSRGWKVSFPPEAQVGPHSDGRIALKLPAGASAVKLRYTSPGLFLGVLVFAIGAPILLVLAMTEGSDGASRNQRWTNLPRYLLQRLHSLRQRRVSP